MPDIPQSVAQVAWNFSGGALVIVTDFEQYYNSEGTTIISLKTLYSNVL